MIFSKHRIDGEEFTGIYFDYESFYRDTFSPTYESITFFYFKIHGKDYQSRKESLRTLAIDWSHADIEGISYSEIALIGDWFYKNGKRYGLLTEFIENAIC